jgi:hypothetical protein
MLCLPCYVYVFSSTKLEIRAEKILPGSKGRERRGPGEEMTQTVYPHMNK